MRSEATMPVSGGPRRAEVRRVEYRTVPRQTPVHNELAVVDEQLESLGADIFALKILLPALLSRVSRLDPILASAIQQGVQDAIDRVEHMIATARRTETRDRYTSALASIRSIRTVVLRN